MIFFIHIPKTGGSTLSSIILKNFLSAEVYHTDNGLATKVIKEVSSLPQYRKNNLKLVWGHMQFGVHQAFPAEPDIKYFTFLRNPIDRIVSHYYYVKSNPDHYLYKKMQKDNMSIEDYVSSGISAELSNGQVRLLASEKYSDLLIHKYGSNNTEALENAINNIEKYSILIGIQEYFDESLRWISESFKWTNVEYSKKNVGQYKSLTELPEKTISIIKEFNQLDIKLYNYALEHFQNKLRLFNILH